MDPAGVIAAFDALDAAPDAVLRADCGTLAAHERLVLLERVERVRRRLPALEHPLLNQLVSEASAEELGGTLVSSTAPRP